MADLFDGRESGDTTDTIRVDDVKRPGQHLSDGDKLRLLAVADRLSDRGEIDDANTAREIALNGATFETWRATRNATGDSVVTGDRVVCHSLAEWYEAYGKWHDSGRPGGRLGRPVLDVLTSCTTCGAAVSSEPSLYSDPLGRGKWCPYRGDHPTEAPNGPHA